MELTDDGEDVGGVQGLQLGVEAARGQEGGEAERAAVGLDARAQNVEEPTGGDLLGEALQELGPGVRAVPRLELRPLLGLGGEQEVENVARQEADGAVVLLGGTLAIAAEGRHTRIHDRRGRHCIGLARLAHAARLSDSIGAVGEQRGLDGCFEVAFRDVHVQPPRSLEAPEFFEPSNELTLAPLHDLRRPLLGAERLGRQGER